MEIVIFFAVLTVGLVVPVMIGARLVNARNTGFRPALLAVVILAALSAVIRGFAGDGLVAFVAVAGIGALALAGVLGTTFLPGLAVSVIATIIQVGLILLLVVFVGVASVP